MYLSMILVQIGKILSKLGFNSKLAGKIIDIFYIDLGF